MVRVTKRKIKASSLLETIVAMVILVAVFTIAIMIFVNVTATGFNFQKIHANNLLKNLSRQTVKEMKLYDENLEVNNILVVKKVSKYQEQKGLFVLELSAFNKDSIKLAQRRELIFQNEN